MSAAVLAQFYTNRVELYRACARTVPGTVPKLFRHSSGTVLTQFRNSSKTILGHFCGSSGAGPVQFYTNRVEPYRACARTVPGTVPELFRHSSGTVLTQFRNSSKTVLGHCCGSSGASPVQFYTNRVELYRACAT